MTDLRFERLPDYWAARFAAMASPCEVLIDTDDEALARRLGAMARDEAQRIERKFSRYRSDNIVHRINHAHGETVAVDEETAALLDYADTCWRLSEGLFDITSGILRQAWRFDGGERVPSADEIGALLPRVGWDKLRWDKPRLTLRPGMEIDLGGIGKEYAVDRVASLLCAQSAVSTLVNFGGDLYASSPRRAQQSWKVGVERPGPAAHGLPKAPAPGLVIELSQGAIATSGDTRRYVLKDGKRYGHILNPRTGWPVEGAPNSVTVIAGTCTEAGMLATFAMLKGPGAEAFLEEQRVRFWCQRG
jgi:thiamine biosynthesis lipoprotein